jgi:hypothetical protein
MTRRAKQAVIALRLRTDGGDGEGMSLAAIAREMGISVSYASSLINDPTGEFDRQRKRKYLNRCKVCGELCWGTHCVKHAAKEAGKKRRKWTEAMIIEAIQEWENSSGNIPTGRDWAKRDGLPDWVPLTKMVYNVFGKNGWNKAIEAAGFKPRPAHAPEWAQNTAASQITPMGPEAREKMSEERKALYAEDPDNPLFRGLREGWDLQRERGERRERRFQAARHKHDS